MWAWPHLSFVILCKYYRLMFVLLLLSLLLLRGKKLSISNSKNPTHTEKKNTHTLLKLHRLGMKRQIKKYFSILMREIIHNNMALGKEEFLSDSFSSFNYLVGKPNTQLVVSVRQKQSVSEKTSERVWNYSKQNTLIVRRELKVSCFSSKTKHSKLYHSETKKPWNL